MQFVIADISVLEHTVSILFTTATNIKWHCLDCSLKVSGSNSTETFRSLRTRLLLVLKSLIIIWDTYRFMGAIG